MSFESAVAIAEVFGLISMLLWLVLPVTAVVCIFRRRRDRPGSNNAFAYIVLAGWVLTIVWWVRSFLAGGWYGENGPPPQITALLAAIMLNRLRGHSFRAHSDERFPEGRRLRSELSTPRAT
jgi:hypothetical protein